jgi:nitroreductase
MDVFDTMKGRQSIRKFRKDPVTREHILRMTEAASWAPTAGNSQNFRFIAVQERETIDRMRGIVDEIVARITGSEDAGGAGGKATYQNLFAFAPAVICVVGSPYESATDRVLREKDPERYKARRFQVNPGLQGISAGITQFLLAACALGYGTCWMTGPLIAKKELESALSVRHPEELLAIIAVGKPDAAPPKPPRKPASEITTFR